jgi:putative endonuclease
MPDPRHILGERAEDVVARWLAGSGWRILARRWRGGTGGELDLVCVDQSGALVGVEVKLRRTQRAGSALEAVDHRRVQRLRLALAAYATDIGRSWPVLRLDVVTVEPDASGWRLRRHAGIDGW